MCIIILNKQGELPKETIYNSYDNNHDSMGMCWFENNKIKQYRTLNEIDKFYAKYQSIRNNFPNETILLHFRIKTSGKIDLQNCHPFLVNKQLCFAHNGRISEMKNDDNYCDTVLFNNKILKDLPNDFILKESYRELLSKYIGSTSKLAFLLPDNEYYIINEDKGSWDKDKNNWYSNDTYKKPKWKPTETNCSKTDDENTTIWYNDWFLVGGWWDSVKEVWNDGYWVHKKNNQTSYIHPSKFDTNVIINVQKWIPAHFNDKDEFIAGHYGYTESKQETEVLTLEEYKEEGFLISQCYECGCDLKDQEDKDHLMCKNCYENYNKLCV